MKTFLCYSLALLTCARLAAAGEALPRVAVFDPEVSTSARFRMDVGEMNGVAQTLLAGGFDVVRVTSAQINDPAVFNAQRLDALVLNGSGVARANFPALTRFAGDGGVLVALSAKSPFGTAVARMPDGAWTYSPAKPQYAWQTPELSGVFGLRYQYRAAMLDAGVRQTPTPLLKKYLPEAIDYTGTTPSTWIYPADGGEFFALLRSQRGDGRDVTPQIYIARKEGRRAVISTADLWTKGGEGWPLGPQTTVAMTRLAVDLKRGAVQLDPADKVDLPGDLAPAEPLTQRIPTGEVNPENAPVVTRWGRFDGSGMDLADGAALPRALQAGASVNLPLRQNARPLWLRLRAAVAQSGAALKVTAGDRVLWNEAIAYAEVADVGNFGALSLSNAPVEFNRRVYLPPTDAAALTISNPGTQPLYFDAAQLENEPAKPARWLTGMGAAWNHTVLRGAVNLPPELTREWTGVRSTLWSQDVGAPGDPDRWQRTEARLAAYRSTGAPLEVLFEGTPKWAAISPERYAAADRKWTVPPDPEQYREIVRYMLEHHPKEVARYELWNEQDSEHYWLGTVGEFVQFCRMVIPLVRREAPDAEIIMGGLTGFDRSFVATLSQAGVIKEADLMAFHPYAGAEAAWDKPFGTFQGQLYSLGENIPIYANEMGFPVGETSWFTKAKFPYTPLTQGRMTDVALARLLANNVSMFSIFLSGGSDGGNSYIDGRGKPYPGYVVLQDYFPLGKDGGRRFDVSVSRPDGQPQLGVYVAGAQHADGHLTVVLNPAEVTPPDFEAPAPEVSVPLVLRLPLARKAAWKAVFAGQETPVKYQETGGQGWGEITLELHRRSVLTITP